MRTTSTHQMLSEETIPERPLRTHALVLVYILTVQYFLGMYINLFVVFPENASARSSWAFAGHNEIVFAHILLALLILIGTAWLCERAWSFGMRRALLLSLLTFLALLLAGASGAAFVTTGAGAWSFSMAAFFMVAVGLLSYVLTARRAVAP